MIGEGANLGVTQAARIAFALKGGGGLRPTSTDTRW
ncbi:MAG: NAD-glutamate dehydrogenase [Sphingomonadales bacterium]|nr:NAD-glutamate dehydrogenase [Sphingomonadales bacterium]